MSDTIVHCKNFPRGQCKFGERCRFAHVNRTANSDATGVALDSIWGFSNEDDSKIMGSVSSAERSIPSKYSDIVISNIAVNQDETKVCHQTKPASICSFFIAGNCKFGSNCRNSHEIDATEVSELKDDETSASPDCGICIAQPSNGLYGLLSHCDCAFCLKCIREWRKSGLSVAKDREQVR